MIEIINGIIAALANSISFLLSFLPDSPFTWNMDGLNDIWYFVTYFIPVQSMVAVTGAYLTAVAAWYVVRWALRLIKYIG